LCGCLSFSQKHRQELNHDIDTLLDSIALFVRCIGEYGSGLIDRNDEYFHEEIFVDNI